MPVELGMRFMGEITAEFMQRYPEVSLEADLSGRVVDLVEEGVDLGLRIGAFNDAQLIGRRLGQLNGRFFASPNYLAQHPAPTDITELASHSFVLFRQAHENTVLLDAGRQPVSVRLTGRLSANNALMQMDAVIAGLGMGLLPGFITDQAVAGGQLVPVLPDVRVRMGDLWAMTPSRLHMSSALRAFIDFLAERVSQHPWFRD